MTTKKVSRKKAAKKTSSNAQPKAAEDNVSSADVSTSSTAVEMASTQKAVPPAPKKSGGALAILSLLISILALGGAAYTWYEIQVRQASEESKLLSDVAGVGSQVTILADRVESLQSSRDGLVTADQLELRLTRAEQQSKEVTAELSDSQSNLLQRVANLQESVAQGANEFALDDVAQLLKAANISALVLNDRDGALNALKIAEQQLLELADPRFITVRQAVLNDIAELEAVEVADIEKLSVALNSLAAQVDTLDLVNEPTGTDQELLSLANQEAGPQDTFTDGLKEMGRDFLSLFTIKVQRVDQPPTPLLAPEQRYFLNLNLKLLLNKVELAALQGRPAVFKQSLTQAQAWVEAYFDTDTASVAEFLQELKSLEQTNLKADLPSVARGYTEFVALRGER